MTSNEVSPARLMIIAVALMLASGLTFVVAGRLAVVSLLTNTETAGCFLNYTESELVVDRSAGTAVIEGTGADTHVTLVMWPVGWSGRASGREVEVLDESGHVMARTGSRYHISGGYRDHAWLACDELPTPLP